MPRDLDLTFDISTGALTLDRVVGNYVKRSETLSLSVTIVSNGASATIPSGLVGTLKPVNAYGTTLAQWTTFAQVGATNVYTASTTINAAAVTTLLGTTTEQANCVFDFAGAGVVESDTLALVLKNNVTRDDDTAPTALLNRNDFLVTNGTGLLVNVAAGYAANGAFVAAQASLAITNATNYIEVTAAGVASVNTTAFTAGSYPLATVVASAGAITSNTDLRAWITPKPATGGGVTSITGTANEITVTGTTTPTLSLPSALTFTAKTITGGTFASPSLTTPTIGDGTEAAPSLSFTTDTNTGVYRPTADTVGIVGGGNDVVRMTGIASATDYLEIKNGIGVGSPLHVLAEGASANIGVHLQPKGSGLFTISDGTDFNKGIRFRSSSSAASAITLLDAVSTAGRVITLPDATGTLALVSGNLGTPSALVGTHITGTASGLTAGNATLAATVTVASEATDTSCFPLFATAATGSLAALSNADLTFNSATGLLSATGLAGAFNGTVGATTPSTVAGTTGTFSGVVSTSGAAAYIYTNGANGHIYTLGANASIFTNGAGGFIETRSTFRLNEGEYITTLSHAPTADRGVIIPDGDGTLLLANGSGANLTSLNASNVSSGTLAAARMANAGVHTGDATGTFPVITLNAAQTGITSVGTLTGGATGAGFTVALSTSTITGTLAADRGGTGVSNTGTITLGGNLVTTGAFNTTFAQAATTTVTLPSTSATMARTDAAQTFSGTQTFGTIVSTSIPASIYIGSAEMIPKTTAGCGVNSSETSTNKINYDTLDFDATTAEGAQFIRTLPSNWNAGTITAVFHWTADSGSGTVTFSLAGYSFGDNVALDTAQGTLQSATDTLQTAGAMHLSPSTSAITIGGTPAAGTPVIFELKRDIADTLAVDARLLGVTITYTAA